MSTFACTSKYILSMLIYANELKCWWTDGKTTITDLTSFGRETMTSSLDVSHYISQALNRILERSWTGTLPSSQMKNAHLMRKGKDDCGDWLHQPIQICYTCTLAYMYWDTHLDKCKKINAQITVKHFGTSLKCAYMHTHMLTHTHIHVHTHTPNWPQGDLGS